QTRFATKYSKCSKANPYPGHILLPAPNGIILISLLPVISNDAPTNLSGLNDIGSSHTFGSHPISATMKFTLAFFGITYSPSFASSVTACGNTKCPGGCRRSPSNTTAFRYGSLFSSSSPISPPRSPITDLISSTSLSWIWGCFTKFAIIHCNAVAVVSVPPIRNSLQRPIISVSVSLRFSSGSSRSKSVSA
ncbi:hypothetical protein LINPERPRIM_LOCUS36888, partial [Linum perenne]